MVGRRVMGIAEPEISRREDLRVILKNRDRVISTRRRVVNARDVDRHRVGGYGQVDAAVGGAAVVADLEVEARVTAAVAVDALPLHDAVPIYVGDRNLAASRDAGRVVLER